MLNTLHFFLTALNLAILSPVRSTVNNLIKHPLSMFSSLYMYFGDDLVLSLSRLRWPGAHRGYPPFPTPTPRSAPPCPDPQRQDSVPAKPAQPTALRGDRGGEHKVPIETEMATLLLTNFYRTIRKAKGFSVSKVLRGRINISVSSVCEGTSHKREGAT